MLSLTSDNSTDSKAAASAGSKGSATSATEVSIGDFIFSMQNKDEPCNHFGRPKGTTAADLMCLAERTELATQEAT
jgi:hypothetical protein